MTFWLVLSVLLGGLVILFGEILRRQKRLSGEASRKLMHISHALVVGSWPFFLSYPFIIGAELLFIAVVLTARHFRLLSHIRAVRHLSWGELFFPIAVIILSLIDTPRAIFLAGMLHLGLADSMAALVGRRFPIVSYKVLDHRKTLSGSFTFAVVSAAITWLMFRYSSIAIAPEALTLGLVIIPLTTTLAENISPYGSDNLSVPLLVSGILGLLILR